MLGNAFRRVARDVPIFNTALLQVSRVEIVDAGGGDTDEAQLFSSTYRLLIHGHLVQDDNVRITNPLRHLFRL